MSMSVSATSAPSGYATPKEKIPSLPTRVSPVHHGAGEQGRVYFIEEVIRSTALYDLLKILRDAGLPDAWLASGAIYQSVWNALTGKDAGHGIKDYDLIYHDEADTSYEAEDRVIKQLTKACEPLGLPVEIRNQARVHLWFPNTSAWTTPNSAAHWNRSSITPQQPTPSPPAYTMMTACRSKPPSDWNPSSRCRCSPTRSCPTSKPSPKKPPASPNTGPNSQSSHGNLSVPPLKQQTSQSSKTPLTHQNHPSSQSSV
ncbi:nucleotidyltransferase family protein [Pseudovibrio denitrificans]|uniref:nucleotidyltransferase family protein n=1 Tax=Pseudovibrio denitrificans TaxID=258256 RepID=UPI000AD081CC